MFVEVDTTKQPVKPQLFLAKTNKTIIGKLNEAYNIKYNPRLGRINELTFSLPYELDYHGEFKRNDNVDNARNRYLIKYVNPETGYKEWFLILKPSQAMKENVDDKTIYCLSLGYELADKLIRDYEVTSYNATQVLTDALSTSVWNIDYIDAEFDIRYRSFSVTSMTVLDFVFEIAKTFGALILWNTENRTINFYNPDNIGVDRGLEFSYGRYLKSLNQEIDPDEFCTRLKLYGRDGLTIREINTTGQVYIEDFGYYLYPFERDEYGEAIKHSYYMSDALCHAILDYNEFLEAREGEFDTLLSEKEILQLLLTEKVNELFELNTEMWLILDQIDVKQANEEDVSGLIVERDTKQAEIDAKYDEIDEVNADISSIEFDLTVTSGASASGDILVKINGENISVEVESGDTASQVAEKISNKLNTLYDFISSVISNVVSVLYYTYKDEADVSLDYEDIDTTGVVVSYNNETNRGKDNQISELRNNIAIENHFTNELITERNIYIKEKDYVNEYCINPKELLELGEKRFEQVKIPPIIIKTDIINFLEIVECQHDWYKLNLGDIVKIKYDKFGINVKAKIIEMQFDYEQGSIRLVIANIEEIESDREKYLRMLNNAMSTSTTVNMSKYKWDGVDAVRSDVNTILYEAWEAAKREINAGVNQSVTVDRRGITIKDSEDPLKFVRMMHSVIGLTSDGGNTFKVAINPSGIVKDKIIYKIIKNIIKS